MRLNSDEYESYYRGRVQNIRIMTHQGVRIQFPASAVRPFLQSEGVNGDFVIIMDADNKLIDLQRVVV